MNRAESKLVSPISRRRFLRDATVLAGGAAVAPLASHPRFAAASTGGAPAEMNLPKSSAGGMTIIEFERELKRMRLQH
ncbi:MAG: twin-arginine translocation signal domain-containing protein, partial [Verrucomicrobiae bacterium]|nr:twin-arginine translocation signal domain-containing protein [Verrucomicrobiae bacterium]